MCSAVNFTAHTVVLQIKDALQMFEGIVGSQFKFLHCWLIMRNEVKWNASLAAASEPNDAPSAQAGDTSNDTLPPTIPRPIGRDRAKKQRSNSTSSNSNSSACLEVLQKMHVDRAAHAERIEMAAKEESREIASRADRKLRMLERQMKIQEEMLQLQKDDREERVMNMDVDKLLPWVRDYYINKQKEIAAKSIGGEGSKSWSPGV